MASGTASPSIPPQTVPAKSNSAFIHWEDGGRSGGEKFWGMTGDDEASGKWAYVSKLNTPTLPLTGWEARDGPTPAPVVSIHEDGRAQEEEEEEEPTEAGSAKRVEVARSGKPQKLDGVYEQDGERNGKPKYTAADGPAKSNSAF